jgi:hypothetical protein
MFKVYISDSVYKEIIDTEEQKATSERSFLYKLLMQQPVQQLSGSGMEMLKTHPENVLYNPSSLYVPNLTSADALAIQRTYGFMCLSRERPNVSPLIDIFSSPI